MHSVEVSEFICTSVLHGFQMMVAWCASCFLLVQRVAFYIFIFTSGFLACIVSGTVAFRSLDGLYLLQSDVVTE